MIDVGFITNLLENMSFTTLPDSRIRFTSTVNGEPKEIIKELDGTLTTDGQNYHPYEKSLEELQSSNDN